MRLAGLATHAKERKERLEVKKETIPYKAKAMQDTLKKVNLVQINEQIGNGEIGHRPVPENIAAPFLLQMQKDKVQIESVVRRIDDKIADPVAHEEELKELLEEGSQLNESAKNTVRTFKTVYKRYSAHIEDAQGSRRGRA